MKLPPIFLLKSFNEWLPLALPCSQNFVIPKPCMV
uniref:Uncharacterized protein n=1 Tax=Rhizophora mucronata TaxID=61149 RepID=A0A2P2Q708_RHIMU